MQEFTYNLFNTANKMFLCSHGDLDLWPPNSNLFTFEHMVYVYARCNEILSMAFMVCTRVWQTWGDSDLDRLWGKSKHFTQELKWLFVLNCMTLFKKYNNMRIACRWTTKRNKKPTKLRSQFALRYKTCIQHISIIPFKISLLLSSFSVSRTTMCLILKGKNIYCSNNYNKTKKYALN